MTPPTTAAPAGDVPRVLVTGGAGYIGAFACRALRAAGFAPVAYDDLSTGRREAARWGPLEIGDIRDQARLDEVVDRHRPEAVMHFAALALVGESVREPARYAAVNRDGTAAVVAAARRCGARSFILSSTCAVYGAPEVSPIREDAPRAPINPYGATKAEAEDIVAAAAGAGAFTRMALRYFNAAGAGDGLGEDRPVETHLVPLAVDAALGRGPGLSVFGRDFPTPDGTAVRDYIHVADLADAHVAALLRLRGGHPGATLNLGTGTGASVAEVIAAIDAHAGRPTPRRDAARRPGDPAHLVADPARARAEIGLVTPRSTLTRIIADTWAWRATLAARDGAGRRDG